MWWMFAALGVASAQVKPVYEVSGASSYQRAGLSFVGRPGLKVPLWNQQDSVLFGDTHLTPSLDVQVSPAYLRSGARVVFSPIAVFDLTAYGAWDTYFGNFQTVVGYPTADTNYGTNDDIAEMSANQASGSGWHAGGAAKLKAKAGPVIVVANGDFSHWNIQADVAGDWFFEREAELMMPLGGGNLFKGDGVLLYEMEVGNDYLLRVGSLTSYRITPDADDTLLRTGLLTTFGYHNWTHALIVQPYLIDRAFDAAGVPFIAYQAKWTKVAGKD